MRSGLAFLLLALPALPAAGLEPYLVKDVDSEHRPGTSYPGGFATVGGAALFQADDGRSGREPWWSDGTEAGTWRVGDVCPGDCSSLPVPLAASDWLAFFAASEVLGEHRTLWATDGSPDSAVALTEFGTEVGEEALWVPGQRALYFSSADFWHGPELWRSDGTPAGTRQVAEIMPGQVGSRPRGFTLFKGRVWFAADGEQGGSLWRTDGTAAGTVMVEGFAANPDVVDAPRALQVVGKRLVFVVPGGPRGEEELWASDGTAPGTIRLLRLARGWPGPVFRDFLRTDRRLYFVAHDSRRGQQLWATDGTAAGTRQLTAFARGEILPLPPGLTRGRLVFAADDGRRGAELWTTDGTPKGTRLLRDVCPGACSGVAGLWRTHRGLLYWVGDDGAHGREPWSTDGTAAGTRLVRDIREGEQGSFPAGPVVLGDRLLFGADDAVHGLEVWSTDGTGAGTVRVSDFPPGIPFDGLGGAVVDGALLFAANGGFEATELWRADGTPAGTSLVRDINDLELGGSRPTLLGALGGTAFFFTGDGQSGFVLWKSDGTEAGTSPVRALGPDEQPVLAAEAAGGRLFFLVGTPSGPRLWRTDGTEAGTFPVTGEGVSLCCGPPRLRAVGDRLFFAAADAAHGNELWVSDGTAEGTRLVEDLRPGASGSDPGDLVAFDGILGFIASGSDGIRRVWLSNGTAPGTGHGPLGEDVSLLTVHAHRLWYFVAGGEALFTSDGSAMGTIKVDGFGPGFNPRLMVSLGTRLVISAFGSSEQEGLWARGDDVTDVTERIGGAALSETSWTVFQGRLVYTPVFHFEPASELAVSDGTEAGTLALPVPGRHGLLKAASFAPLGDRLLFTSDEGRLLWETDGATVAPVPGVEPAEGGTLLPAGPRVFLPASSPATGVELWAIR